MADKVLESFFLSLGWKVDEESQRKFNDSVKAVSKVATGLAATFTGMALAATAAVAKVAASFDTLLFVSQRTGSSVQGIKSLQYAFSQLGGSSEQATGSIESFARSLRTNPGLQKFIGDLGVATMEGGKARDSVEVLLDSIDAIKKRNPYYVGAQYAELLGIDESTFNLLSRQMDQLKTFRAEYDRIAKAIALDNEEAAKAGASFQRSLTSIYAILSAVGQKLLIELAPGLERVAKALLGWFEAHPQEVAEALASIHRAVETFAKSVENGDLARGLERIGTSVLAIGKGLESILGLMAKLGLVGSGESVLGRGFTHLFGSKEEVTGQIERDLNRQREAEQPGLLRRGYNYLRRKIGLSTDEGSGAGAGAPQDAPGGSKASIAGKTFREKAPGVMKRLIEDFGLSKEEAGVVLGNLGHESAGFTAFEEGGNGPGPGWAQWTDPGRKRRFFEYAKQRGLDPKSDEANYGFLRWELQNTHKGSIAALKRAETTEEKMRVFERDFEGAGVKAYGSRNKYMRDAIKAFDDAQNRPLPPPPSNDNPSPAISQAPPRKMQMPGGGVSAEQFDRMFLSSPPMGVGGSTTTTNDHRSITIQNDVTLQGTGDGRSDTQRWELSMERYSSGALRDAQTAIR